LGKIGEYRFDTNLDNSVDRKLAGFPAVDCGLVDPKMNGKFGLAFAAAFPMSPDVCWFDHAANMHT
jgi:hypothetical protein